MGKRIKLSREELEHALSEQLKMLEKSCMDYDRLRDDFEFKRIAVHLRTLWHNTNRSKSLASQLNLDTTVVDTAFAVPPTFIGPSSTEDSTDERRLFAVGGNRAYTPLFDTGPAGVGRSPFKQWWEGNVISDGEGNKFTRKDLVLEVANTDGGAHVDPELNPLYYALTRKETFGVIRAVPTDDPKVFRKISTPSPVAVTLRQIAHETLKTLIPDYHYDGRRFYPGVSTCWMTAYIEPND